jgi:thiosulfate dehydrogenase [quinone] large subunit
MTSLTQAKRHIMNKKIIKLFLRFGIGIGFLSAVADRFGLWPAEVSSWGNWESFLEYTKLINPIIPESLIPAFAAIATGAEIIFGISLIIGFKTELVAKLSGFLMLIFALSIAFSTGIKGVFDYSVFAASAGAFGLSVMNEKYLELDSFLSRKN